MKILNLTGPKIRGAHKAISIFGLNAREYPKSTLAYESLAETYKLMKDKTNALQYFEKARELDPQNPHWGYMIEKVGGSTAR